MCPHLSALDTLAISLHRRLWRRGLERRAPPRPSFRRRRRWRAERRRCTATCRWGHSIVTASLPLSLTLATALPGTQPSCPHPQAAWKLLADVRMQHGAVPTLSAITAARDASQQQPVAPAAPTASLPAASPEAAAAAAWVRQQLAAGTDRLAALRSTRRCYAAALHLDPRVAGLYGDLAMSYHMEVELAAQHPALQQVRERDQRAQAFINRL